MQINIGKLLAVAGALMVLDQVPGAEAVEYNNAFKTCLWQKWMYTKKGHLFGTCATNAVNGLGPEYRTTVLDTNRCFTNNGGKITRRDEGNYIRSCKDCKLEWGSLILNCKCKNPKGGWKGAKIDMNKYLGNDDGYFCCREGSRYYSAGFPTVASTGHNVTLVSTDGDQERGLEFTADGGLGKEQAYDDAEGSLDLDEVPFEEVGIEGPEF